jgi:hypothetical protein
VHKKHGAISVVSVMLIIVRHNSFVIRPTEPDPDDKVNMEQGKLVWDNQKAQRKSCMCAVCTLEVLHGYNWE